MASRRECLKCGKLIGCKYMKRKAESCMYFEERKKEDAKASPSNSPLNKENQSD